MYFRWITSVKHNNLMCLHKTPSGCSLLMLTSSSSALPDPCPCMYFWGCCLKLWYYTDWHLATPGPWLCSIGQKGPPSSPMVMYCCPSAVSLQWSFHDGCASKKVIIRCILVKDVSQLSRQLTEVTLILTWLCLLVLPSIFVAADHLF